ncbi:MAG: LUD domain-containing protein [Candidatus Woesebacteria bacterium]
MSWNTLANQESIEKTISALKINGIEGIAVADGAAAIAKVKELIPEGSEVMTMTSVTADTIGLTQLINESGKYNAVKPKLYALDPNTQKREQKQMGAAPEYSVGSVHAVTEDGKVLIASNTGSQLPGYVYGSDHVIWVVGAQKIVKDINAAFKRVEEYTLPLESERAHKAYGMERSNISKVLIVNKEVTAGRITLIFINEVLGF